MDKDENKDIELTLSKEEEKPTAGKAAVIIIGLTLALFIVVLFFTEFLGNQFGKTVEICALIVIALILGVVLYKSNRSK